MQQGAQDAKTKTQEISESEWYQKVPQWVKGKPLDISQDQKVRWSEELYLPYVD